MYMCIYIYIYIYVCMYVCVCMCIYIYIYIYKKGQLEKGVFGKGGSERERPRRASCRRHASEVGSDSLHSAKAGAVESGCSGLHHIIGCFSM